MVVTVGETKVVPLTATVPTPLLTLTSVAPVVAQFKVVDAPAIMGFGVAMKELITGRVFTFTVTLSVRDPYALTAVMVYVVVTTGDTVYEVMPVTSPTP